MGDEHTTPSPHTTRFLFPQPQQAVHTVFESKRQQGLPGVKEKPRQACLPPLRGGTRGLLVAPDGKPGSSLACYKHYDVHLDWSETDVDTSVWAGDVQAYTRMFYARYGAGPPGATPWRLGRGLKPQNAREQVDGQDTDTFMTRAHIEIQRKLKHTSLDLWQQFSSSPIDTVDLDVIKMWAEAMRPRSIHDLKPMLMLCQSLLRDLAYVHKEQLVLVREEMQKSVDQQLEQAKFEQQAREKALQMRVESLNALVTAPLEPRPDVTSTEQVTDLKREHEAMLANLVAQLEEKEADLVAISQDLIARGGVPKGANGKALPVFASTAAHASPPPPSPSPKHNEAPIPVCNAAAAMPAATECAVSAAEVNRYPAEPTTPGPNSIQNLAASGHPCGTTADGHQILQLRNGARVVVAGYRADGSPIYTDADDPSKVIVGVDTSGALIFGNRPITGTDASGAPIYGDTAGTGVPTQSTRSSAQATPGVLDKAPLDISTGGGAGRVVMGMDAAGTPIYGEPGATLCKAQATATGQKNAAGQETFALADGTEVVVVGRTASGSPIYALADDPRQVIAGIDASGTLVFANQSTSTDPSSKTNLSTPFSVAGARSHGGNSYNAASIGQELSVNVSQTSVHAALGATECYVGPLEPGTVPPPQVVVREDGTKRYVFPTLPGAEPLEVGHQAVIATTDDGTPIFAAGTVLGFTADGAAVVANGRGGTYEDNTLGNTRVNAAAVSAVLNEREARVRDARLAGVVPQAALFAAAMGTEPDHARRAGEYLAAAVLQHAAPNETAQTAARFAISAVQSGTAEPEVFAVGELAVNCEGAVVGRLANDGLTVVDFDGATICSVEKVTHKDGEVLTQAGTVVPEESVEKATDSIVKAAVVRSCVVDDAVVGYMSSHKRVIDDSGSVLGTFDGTDIVHGGQRTNLGAQTGEVVSLEDLSDAAFRGAAQAEQESVRVCLPPDFAYALGPTGAVLGQVLADGQVIGPDGGCKAMMQPDGAVKTSEGLLVGAAARGMAVLDQQGKLVAVLNEQGFVKSCNNKPLQEDVDMDDTGLLATSQGDVIGFAVGAAPRANAAVRNAEGELVGYEDAKGVVCNSEGAHVARLCGTGIVSLPGMVAHASEGHKIDLDTTVVLDSQNQVVGSSLNTDTCRTPQRLASGSPQPQVAVSGGGHRQSNGLVYSSDGSVVGSCVSVVVAGLAVVSTSGAIIGDVSAEGVVTSGAGAEIGTVDKNNVLWSPSGSVVGAVSALHSVRSSTGSLAGAVSGTGTVVDNSLAPVPTAACRGVTVWSDGTSLLGTVQGRPPPLFLLEDSSRKSVDDVSESNENEDDGTKVDSRTKSFSVAWSDLRVTSHDGEPVGWWCSRRSCVVDEVGELLLSPTVQQEADGPSGCLPQALAEDGSFLGYVLPSKAVVDPSGHQVGAVMPDGTVFDSSLAPIGAYNLAGYKSHCNVVGANGSPLGFLQPDGRVISPQDGVNTGFLTPSGTVISETGQFVGVVRMPSMEGLSQDADGIVRDADGNAVGRICTDGTMAMGDPFAIREPPEMVNEAVQVCMAGLSLAQLLAGESDRPPTPPTKASSEASSSSSARLKKLRAATKLIGLTNVSKRNFIKEQLERLAELRAQILEKMQSRQVKDSLLELRKYRRPPRAAAQVITALMVIYNEPLCVEWRHQALQGLQFPDHPNHVAQIWVALTPLLQPNLSETLAGVDGTDLSQDMHDRLKAAQQIMQGMTEKEAQRASYVVRLLHEFIDLLQESNLKAHEFAQLED